MLRVIFGSQDGSLNELRRIVPPLVSMGSTLAVLPVPRSVRRRIKNRYTPWGRFLEQRDAYHELIRRLVEMRKADPDFDSRDDILTSLLKSRYEDGSAMSVKEIADEVLTLLAAGMKPRPRRWLGRSSGSHVIPMCSPR